ncbi:amino acid adenylation domain-containing protein [Amycolatopsis sp. OK19-0408]|uniref:Amino acid adenylation domain-containing protein n=1 Tax=Amycolatopsis iheyensis TaxID=2945988 RepID=A0A9X2N852_9PSEU|nr:amino acid adenylation domain-containing protein [Amycolatopsis iheyensis]MCR6481999.1 amino acid adenylation domain-containing protein [Amycolatopsis iheyensis]
MTDTLPVAGTHGPPLSYPDTTVAGLVLAQAQRTPDALAVRQGECRLTYAELLAAAGGVAAALRDRGVGPGTRVGVCGHRRPALVATVLGVLLAGGCYVPLEPGGPRDRLAGIAADAGVSLVIGDAAVEEFGAAVGIDVPPPAAPGPCPASPDDIAHVLYTSGSTGRPKGVLTSHRNIVAFVTGFAERLGAGPGSRVLGVSSLAFDAFTMDVFVPLAVGGSVQLAGAADRADPERLRRFVVEHDVNFGFITPALLSLVDPADVPGWRVVACGGEPVPAELAARWLPGRRFFNVYGPTETTVVVLTGEVTGVPADPLPLGTPTPNHRAHVVGDDLRPVPPGEVGELLIGGPGLAEGYLGSPGLTARKFVDDPFTPGERLYRTGDLARLRADGRLEFAGRADRQVKVRGQRIELGEVETVLGAHPGIDAVAVEAVPGPGGTRLVAFLTPASAPSDEDIRSHAGARLTEAMRPAVLRRLDALPVNPVTGKIDRPALRALVEEQPEADLGDSPVAAVWRQVLGPGAGPDFLLAGGDSITAMRLVAALRKDLAADVAVEDVLIGRTLDGLTRRVAAAAPLTGPGLTTGHAPALSPPQRRLWFLDQLAPDAAPYNIAMAFRLSGPLDIDALRAALRAVAERHDVLRWRIRPVDGVPVAECLPPGEVELPVVPVAEAAVRDRLAADAATPIRLDLDPPWRVRLYAVGPQDHVLGFTLHHAVFDGWSQDLLCADLAAAYRGAALPPLPASYADYAVWRADRDRRREAVDLAWWSEHLAGAPSTLDLPRDRPRPAVQTYRGATRFQAFPDGVAEGVGELATRTGTTRAGVVLAAFGELLRRLTGGDDHLVATVVADRQLAETQDVAGFFVDIVPVRLRGADTDFTTLVRQGGAELLAATAHPAAPLDRLVDALGVTRDPARAPLVQVMVNVLNFTEPRLGLPEVTSTWRPVEKPGSPFDLTVYVLERGVELLYNPDLFDAARMSALAEDFTTLLAALVAEPAGPAGSRVPEVPRPSVRASAPGASARERPVPQVAVDPAALAVTEALIAAVWREVLGLDAVRVTDNFFDVGGHSLALAKVHAEVTTRLGRRIPMVDLFSHPTVRALATHLHAGAAPHPELARAAERVAARRGRTPSRRPRRSAGTTGHEQERPL